MGFGLTGSRLAVTDLFNIIRTKEPERENYVNSGIKMGEMSMSEGPALKGEGSSPASGHFHDPPGHHWKRERNTDLLVSESGNDQLILGQNQGTCMGLGRGDLGLSGHNPILMLSLPSPPNRCEGYFCFLRQSEFVFALDTITK